MNVSYHVTIAEIESPRGSAPSGACRGSARGRTTAPRTLCELSLSLSLSLSIYIYIYTYLSISLSLHIYIYIYIYDTHQCIYVYMYSLWPLYVQASRTSRTPSARYCSRCHSMLLTL